MVMPLAIICSRPLHSSSWHRSHSCRSNPAIVTTNAMSSSDSSDDDPLCIHATVKITGDQCKFETKILLHNDGKEKFVDVINSVLTEYAHTSVDADSSAGDSDSDGSDGSNKDDPVKVAVRGYVGRIRSITYGCSSCNLRKFLENSKTKIKTINDDQTPIYTKGITIELHSLKATKRPPSKDQKKALLNPIALMMGVDAPTLEIKDLKSVEANAQSDYDVMLNSKLREMYRTEGI